MKSLITLQLSQIEDMRRYIRFLESELLAYDADHRCCEQCSRVYNANQGWTVNDNEIVESRSGEFCSDICAERANIQMESFQETLESLDR